MVQANNKDRESFIFTEFMNFRKYSESFYLKYKGNFYGGPSK